MRAIIRAAPRARNHSRPASKSPCLCLALVARSGRFRRNMEAQRLDPGPIVQTAFAFWNSKVLLTAVSFGLFTKLGQRRLTGAELGRELELHPRGIADFFDALVAMKF